MFLPWFMPITVLEMQLLALAHTIFFFGREPRLPMDVEFGLAEGKPEGFPW